MDKLTHYTLHEIEMYYDSHRYEELFYRADEVDEARQADATRIAELEKEAEEYKEYCESSIRANCLVQQKLREAYAAVAKLERVYEYEKRKDSE